MWVPRSAIVGVSVISIFGVGLCLNGPAMSRDPFSSAIGHAAGVIKNLERSIPNGGGGSGRHSGGGSHRDRDRGHDDDDSSSSSDDSAGKSEKGSDSAAKTVEKAVAASKDFAARRHEADEWQRAKNQEAGRNVEQAISGPVGFIAVLKQKHQEILHAKVNVDAASGVNINQITAGELRPGLESAYQKAGLAAFERYSGELWTRDRLLVSILNQAKKGLAPYFEGVGAKGPSMAEINELFVRSAKAMYVKALEINEVFGISLSFDRFVRTMYEHADRDASLWEPDKNGRFEQPDSKYERVATLLLDRVPAERFIPEKSENAARAEIAAMNRQFLYRFRARRAIYDCLSAHYGEFVAAAPAGKTIEAGYSADSANKPQTQTSGLWPQKKAGTSPPKASGDQTDNAMVANAFVVELTPAGLSTRVLGYIANYCGAQAKAVETAEVSGNIVPISARDDASVLFKPEDPAAVTPAANRSDN